MHYAGSKTLAVVVVCNIFIKFRQLSKELYTSSAMADNVYAVLHLNKMLQTKVNAQLSVTVIGPTRLTLATVEPPPRDVPFRQNSLTTCWLRVPLPAFFAFR